MAAKIQPVQVGDCDRCIFVSPAVVTRILNFDGNQYLLRLCREHEASFERDMRLWACVAQKITER